MKNFNIHIIAFFLLFSASLYGTNNDTVRCWPVSFSVFNNATQLPGSGVAGIIHLPVHPGFSFGTQYQYKLAGKYRLYQTARAGYFYQSHAHHAIQLYSELGYDRLFGNRFSLRGKVGAGYMHFFPISEVFEFKDGEYQVKSNRGRPQLMFTVSLGPAISLINNEKINIKAFVDYQFWLQYPFVNEYIPLLPNSSLHVGTLFYLFKNE